MNNFIIRYVMKTAIFYKEGGKVFIKYKILKYKLNHT